MRADIKTVLSAPTIRGLAVCDGGGYQDDKTADWEFTEEGLQKLARAIERAVLEAAPASSAMAMQPVDMVLYCPACGLQHIDAPEEAEVLDTGNGTQYEMNPDRWLNPPHRSHLCHGCGIVWRPADIETNGVDRIKTKGAHDTPVQASDAGRQG